ncbi:MAG: hypothetical protein ACKV2V_29675 [Blastocatellia bacterium]
MKKPLPSLLLFLFIPFYFTTPGFAQTAQPAITSLNVVGGQRGQTATFTIDGLNLGGATDLVWNGAGIAAKITQNIELTRPPRVKTNIADNVIVDRATLNRLTIQAVIAADARMGEWLFRLQTPLGTSNLKRFYVTPFPEMASPMNGGEAPMVKLPATISGVIARVGEVDEYRFSAAAGAQLVFEIIAARAGSQLNAALTLVDGMGNTLATNDDFNGAMDSLLGYRIEKAGEYAIRVTDAERSGGNTTHGYRLNAGAFAYQTHVFPLGARAGTNTELVLSGFNLGGGKTSVNAPPPAYWNQGMWLRAGNAAAQGAPLNAVRIDTGMLPEITESGGNNTIASAQKVTFPLTINGRIQDDPAIPHSASRASQAADYFRFTAKKGQRLVLETAAQRFGSPLDTVIDVLDARGKPVPRVVARCLLETKVTLNDPVSDRVGLRLENWNGVSPGDYMMIGNELLRVERLPNSPDEDTFFIAAAGQRIGFEDTTPETHAVGTSVYKVSLHAPGTALPANGLPVATLSYRNDDQGARYGAGAKDSRLHFTAPADGEYIVRLTDLRGWHGEQYAYRLTIREPQPDFTLGLDPENPNVPLGGARPINVTALRLDGFDGDIEVSLLGVPAGFTATTGRIPAGQTSTQILLSAAPDAKGHFALRARGVAVVAGRQITHETANDAALSLVSVAPAPELLVMTGRKRVEVRPGGQAYVDISIKRQGGFAGRVPFEVRGLPPGVILRDLGLNGIMITEEETTQRFMMEVQPWVKPLEQQFFVIGRVETTSSQPQLFPAAPLTLSISHAVAGEKQTLTGKSGTGK